VRDVSPPPTPGSVPEGPGFSLEAIGDPLDLLLHRVRTREVDITTIALAELMRRYSDSTGGLASPIDLEVAGEYLIVASTLVHLKSRLLLPAEPSGTEPTPEEQVGGVEPGFPGDDVVRGAVAHLQERELLMERLYNRPSGSVGEYASECGIEADLFSLVRAFQAILRRVVDDPSARLTRERLTLVERIDWLLLTLRRERRVGFQALFLGLPDRVSCILTFLALLEVIRLRLVRAYSSHHQHDLLIVLVEEEPETAAEEVPRV
jgi:segregation and condensation protein A